MRRIDLEHLIRACSEITQEYELVVIGSQAILGTHPNPPAELTVSAEADIYPLNNPALSELIDGAIGEGSVFHETNGYYAQGVDIHTAKLPHDWRDRVVRVPEASFATGVGYCIGVLDLFLSKAAAGGAAGDMSGFVRRFWYTSTPAPFRGFGLGDKHAAGCESARLECPYPPMDCDCSRTQGKSHSGRMMCRSITSPPRRPTCARSSSWRLTRAGAGKLVDEAPGCGCGGRV
ncbi:MAG: hypothetical protein U5M53_07875 [Rhodoferax sp.]|nr:hypothetical protein [Rhodoferax sp.]